MSNIQKKVEWNTQYQVTVISGNLERKYVVPKMTILHRGQQQYNNAVSANIHKAADLFKMDLTVIGQGENKQEVDFMDCWKHFKNRFSYLEPNDIMKAFQACFEGILPNSEKIYERRHINGFYKTFSDIMKLYDARVKQERLKIFNALQNPPDTNRYKPNHKDRLDSFFECYYDRLCKYTKQDLALPDKKKHPLHEMILGFAYDAFKETSKLFNDSIDNDYKKQVYNEALQMLQRQKDNEEKKKNPWSQTLTKLAPSESMKQKAIRIAKCRVLEKIAFVWAKQELKRGDIVL